MAAPEPARARIALALSGGGHRATLFTLGALMYVVDAGRQGNTTSIASVSGGSITNGFVAQTLDFQDTNPEEFAAKVAAPLAGQIASAGTLFAPLLTKLYLACLAVGLLAAFLPLWLLATPWWCRHLAVLVSLLAWGWLFGLRGRVCAWALRVTLFSPDGTATPLAATYTRVSHVLCATELRTAEAFYFSGDFVYGFWFGPGQPGALPLYRAVQASAAFPGGFPPSRIPRRPHRFQGPLVQGKKTPKGRNLILTDGGVYDNMGDQWAMGFRDRVKIWPWLRENHSAPTQLVVINASARVPWVPFRGGSVPLWSELAAFSRVTDIMYVNTTNVRRQDIVGNFNPLKPDQVGNLPGALVQIAQSPFDVAERYAEIQGHPVGERARAVVQALDPDSKEEWAETARKDAAVGTTLSKLGTDVSAKLLYHGYVTAMCNLHVVFGQEGEQGGWPLLPVPSLERFRALIQRAPAASPLPGNDASAISEGDG